MQIYSLKNSPDYAVIDVETTFIKDGEVPKTLFWGYADSRGYKYFATTNALLKFLRHETPKVLLHHSNFDIIQLLVDGCRDIDILKSHNGKLIKCKLQNHTTINTYSVFPVSLKKIFAAFGFKKTDLGRLKQRNYEDCVNGLSCFLQMDALFVKLVGVSPLQKGTIAATGFSAAEKYAGRMPKDLRFLRAYRGGRVEVYDTRVYCRKNELYQRAIRRGLCTKDVCRVSNDASKYDIHSSYPTSFVDAPKTTKLLQVEIKTKDWYCPLFDANEDQMLIFPNGIFSSYVYSDTLEKYVEPVAEKTTIRIKSRHRIDLCWIVELRGLIQTIYDKKSISTGGIELCCKFLLNAMYGRIGLRGESERAKILDYKPDGDDITIHYLGRKRWLAFYKVTSECRSNFPFAAYITDNARARLFVALKRNAAIYGDTDSVVSNQPSFIGDVSNKLGGFENEGRGAFCSRNVKDYWNSCYDCDGKGCKKCEKGFISTFKGGTDYTLWTFKQFAKGKTAEDVHRERVATLRKRIVNHDGTTDPLTYGK